MVSSTSQSLYPHYNLCALLSLRDTSGEKDEKLVTREQTENRKTRRVCLWLPSHSYIHITCRIPVYKQDPAGNERYSPTFKNWGKPGLIHWNRFLTSWKWQRNIWLYKNNQKKKKSHGKFLGFPPRHGKKSSSRLLVKRAQIKLLPFWTH